MSTTATPKKKFKRQHQERCGGGSQRYDSYSDVKEACERKLAEWEKQGILPPSMKSPHDWLFATARNK
jgi:hypothetical protein